MTVMLMTVRSLWQQWLNAHDARPQGRLFLGVSVLIWAAVSLRWVIEFIEEGHPLTWVVAGILLLFGVLMGLEPLLTKHQPKRATFYLLLQMGLITVALLLYYQLDFFALLYSPLMGQATFIFPRKRTQQWLAVFTGAIVLGQIHQFGLLASLPFTLMYTTALFFVMGFIVLALQAEQARQDSQKLLQELQEAHQQLQQYAGQAEELAIVKERNRLARELHDSVAQTLYGLNLQAEAASRRLTLGQTEKVADYLATFRTKLTQTLQETRLLIYELRPPILEQVGLVPALQARLQAVEGRGNLTVHTEIEEVGKLPAKVEMGVYRLVQEALNNVLKHAQASEVVLRLKKQTNGLLLLQVQDNGVGFEAGEMPAKGFGLQGMQERAESLGGTFKIESGNNKGTTITVEVPL